MQFKIGDVVRLKSGGPEMVVEQRQEGDEVRVAWTYGEAENEVTEHIRVASGILTLVVSNDTGVQNSMEPSELYHTIAELTHALKRYPLPDLSTA